MKKNTMMRVASALLVAVLLTTCAISGTFAKYVTSDNAQDSARVAKWGVVVTATGDAFEEKYNDEANVAGTKVVSSVSGEDVLAPGTNGPLAAITVAGKPEVMVDVDVNATLTLSGWEITGDWDNNPGTTDTTIEYCPVVFTIGGKTYGTIDGVDYKSDDVADLEDDIELLLNKTATNVAANTELATTYDFDIDWNWAFNGDNVKDTALGNLAAAGNAPTIDFTCDVTVTQVD